VGSSSSKTITVTNPVSISRTIRFEFGSGDSAPYAVNSATCALALRPHGSCIATVAYKPIGQYDSSTVLLIKDGDNTIASVSLTGN
jgi:hypothetical protein